MVRSRTIILQVRMMSVDNLDSVIYRKRKLRTVFVIVIAATSFYYLVMEVVLVASWRKYV